MELQMKSLADAVERISAALPAVTHASHPANQTVTDTPDAKPLPRAPSRTSTPKKNWSVRHSIIQQESLLDDIDFDEPILANATFLNCKITKSHAEKMAQATAARFPRAEGKPVYDIYLNRQVAYYMPRHFLNPHSQRRIKSLDSHDELSVPEFLQGFASMILQRDISDPVISAMVLHIQKLGEALVDYEWSDIIDWSNSTLHDIGQGRYDWTDEAVIMARYNDTKMRSSSRQKSDAQIPACALYNQGRCEKHAAHDNLEHICVSCWLLTGARYPHPYTTCRRRAAHSNNQNRSHGRDQQQANGQHGQSPWYRRQYSTQQNTPERPYHIEHNRFM